MLYLASVEQVNEAVTVDACIREMPALRIKTLHSGLSALSELNSVLTKQNSFTCEHVGRVTQVFTFNIWPVIISNINIS
jgi:hypothetical protein